MHSTLFRENKTQHKHLIPTVKYVVEGWWFRVVLQSQDLYSLGSSSWPPYTKVFLCQIWLLKLCWAWVPNTAKLQQNRWKRKESRCCYNGQGSPNPYPNLIEMLWDLRRAVHKWMPANLNEDNICCKEEWDKYPSPQCEKLITSHRKLFLLLKVSWLGA